MSGLNKKILKSLSSFTFLFLVGCMNGSYRNFNDIHGNPIEDVLVLSVQMPYIFQSHSYVATKTDANGSAYVAGHRDFVALKKGYYPVGLGYSSEPLSNYADHTIDRKGSVVLFPYDESNNTKFDVKEISFEPEVEELLIYEEGGVTIRYRQEMMYASSQSNNLLWSEYFFFMPPNMVYDPLRSEVEGQSVDFYVYEGRKPIKKILVSYRGASFKKDGSKQNTIHLFTSDIVDPTIPILKPLPLAANYHKYYGAVNCKEVRAYSEMNIEEIEASLVDALDYDIDYNNFIQKWVDDFSTLEKCFHRIPRK